MLTLNTEIININRVGKTTAKRLQRLGIKTGQDLLFYFPFRYDDFSQLTKIDKLIPGMSANIVGKIELIQNRRSLRKRMYITEALVSDNTETMKVIWFNQPFIAKSLRVGDKVSLAGKVEDEYGGMVMVSPNYEKINLPHPIPPLIRGGNGREGFHTQGLVPNYHLTANITQKQIRFLVKQIINLAKKVTDWLPFEIKRNLKLLSLGDAVSKIHFPKTKNDIEQARRRLSFNELFLIQAQSQLIKQELKSSLAKAVEFKKKETKKLVTSLPFDLTDDQRKAAWEILQDMAKAKPMARLLEGDVGSGKTVVAVIAMLNVALNKCQAVLMVPTEILAQQHFESICKLLSGTKIKIGLITRGQKKLNYESGIMNKELNKKKSKIHNSVRPDFGELSRTELTTKAKSIIHDSQIIIGTHALIQEKVEFNNLVLAIIDEQHRFGVEQRKMLIEKSGNKKTTPHLLSMTATPIPRSLALALYGDLDISIIKQMPKGRKKIITSVVPEAKREDAYDFIRKQIKNGRQVFVICPLIDFSDKLGVKSVKEEFVKLDKEIFPDLSISFLHGRMKAKEKEAIMRDFLNKKIKILVSTSVVEVGVDVPNTTIMMIEGAGRFGLAQLHQFRGRVGRAEHQSYCFLFTDSQAEKTLKRLQALVDCYDGFALAKMDLRFRGPGEVYGTAQKGFPELKIATLFDYELMKQARDEAVKLIDKDPNLDKYPGLKKKIEEQNKVVHLE